MAMGMNSRGYIEYHRDTQDGHGGRAEEHHREMREIAEQAIKELVPEMAKQIYNESLTNLLGALRYDVETCVSVAVDSAEEIFRSSRLKHVISDHIMKELQSHLSNIGV